MRSLSIADAFRLLDEDCLFVTSDNGLGDIIADRGYNIFSLNSNYNNMDSEFEGFCNELDNHDVKAIFVDSYFVTNQYLSELRSYCKKRGAILVYIDDVLEFPYPCDVLLNYNIYANRSDYDNLFGNQEKPIFLLNTAYMPIRREFQNLEDRIIREDSKNILISTGGADYDGLSLHIVESIMAHNELKNYCFHCVIGLMNPNLDEIIALGGKTDNIIIHSHVDNISELMKDCDVAISAAGSTLYELCATQTPTITYVLADNQISGAKGFEKRGILKYAGDIRMLGTKPLVEKLINDAISLANDYKQRMTIAEKMGSVIDGQGANRIAVQIIEIWKRKSRIS